MFGRQKPLKGAHDVQVVALGDGALVEGDPAAIEAFVDRVEGLRGSVGSVTRRTATALSMVGHVAAIAQTHCEYLQFSPEAAQRLKSLKAIPTENGYFRSFVRSGNGFAGNLDWKPVALGPDRVLALQTVGAQLALQAAVREVLVAIERVEGKVDKLAALVRAERLGAVVADNRTLTALAERARNGGRISATDWSTVDTLGAQIARDVESLRSYVRHEVKEVKTSPLVRARSSEMKELADEMLRESLALLVVAEHNYVLWQEVRIGRVATAEPEELESSLEEARRLLNALHAADEEMIRALQEAVEKLLEPTGYEGFALLQRHRLVERGAELNDTIEWFASQRNLDFAGRQVEMPTLRQSVGEVQHAVTTGARTVKGALSTTVGRITNRGSDDASPSDAEE